MSDHRGLRGINLGGWLVAERWMTPELFKDVKADGEIALVRELGYDAAKARLIAHRESFITEEDFAWIAEHGFDFVRLPVGYWLFEQTDDFIDGEHYLKKAFEWAALHELGVVLDFHGLQGSQNGYDHSGQVGKVRLYRRRNKKAALKTFEYMCRTYGRHEALIGMEVINEPKTRWFLWRLLRYYDASVRIAQRYTSPQVKIIVSDAFKPLRMARALARRSYGSRVVLDVHLYQVFDTRYEGFSYDQHVVAVEGWRDMINEVSAYVPVMIGEWSAALPSSATEPATKQLEYYHAQRSLFDETSWAHCYWSYKAPGAGRWDYRSSIHTKS